MKTKYTIWFVLLSFLFTLGLSGCKSKEDKLAGFVAKGDQLLAANDPVRAELEYKNALQIDPKSIPAMMGLGRVALQKKEFQKAFSTFKTVVEMDANQDAARMEVAWLLAMGKQGQQALLEIQQLKEPDKYQPRLDIIKARAQIASERHEEAVKTLSKIKDGANNKEVQMLLAEAQKSAGNLDAMRRAVERWRAIDPEDPTSYLFLVQHYAEKDDKHAAAEQLQKMVAADPADAKRALLQTQLLERLGLIEQAEQAYAKLPAEPEMIKAQADFWVRRGNRDKALSLLESLVAKSPEDVDAVLKLGQILMDQGKNADALALLDKSLEKELQKADREKVLLARATVEAREGNWDAAKSICQAVLKENQGNMDAHLLFGKVLLSTGDAETAEIHLNQAAAARPEHEEAQILLARSQLQNKKDSLAEDTLKKAVDANPKSTRLRLELVRYFLSKKNPAQADGVLKKGLELQPADLLLLKTRGELDAAQKEFGEAQAAFEKLIELKPDNPLGYIEMGRLKVTESNLDEAITWFQQAADKENGWPVAVPALIKIFLAQNKPDEAVGLAHSELAKRPDSAPMQFILGQTLLATGDLAGSEAAFKKASELAPDWPDAYRGMAEVYMRQGNLKEAIAKVEEAHQKKPSPAIRLQLAALYEQDGRYQDAIAVYNELLEKSGRSPSILNNLAYLLAESSDDPANLDKAARLVAEALLQEPENPAFLDTSAWIAYKQKDSSAAWTAIQGALLKAPDSGLHNLHAAMIAHAMGDKEQAAKYLDKALELKLDEKSELQATALRKELEGGK